MFPQFKTSWVMITGGDVVLPGGGVLEGGTILINQGGVIHDVCDKAPASVVRDEQDISIVDASGCWVTPGLIDQHLHGAFGIDFNQSSIEQVQELLRQLPAYGITAVLPTLITAPKLDMVASLSKLEEVISELERDQARILGIHLEGPFLNPQYRGAHPEQDLLKPSLENLEGLLSPSLKRITLAPEMDEGFQIIHNLIDQGILCSMGHSGADYEAAWQAFESGANCATHLYNAMASFHHRHPGMAVAALNHDETYVELIADGIHIAPPVIHLTLRLKPFEKALLISDCNALTGMPPGSSLQFGKQRITVGEDLRSVNEEGRLAGSTSLITDCVRNLVQWQILSFPEAVQLATLHPAEYLGETPHFGQITPGATADVILWKKSNLDIQGVFLSGEPVVLPEKNPTSIS